MHRRLRASPILTVSFNMSKGRVSARPLAAELETKLGSAAQGYPNPTDSDLGRHRFPGRPSKVFLSNRVLLCSNLCWLAQAFFHLWLHFLLLPKGIICFPALHEGCHVPKCLPQLMSMTLPYDSSI